MSKNLYTGKYEGMQLYMEKFKHVKVWRMKDETKESYPDKIYLIQQFFIHGNAERRKEMNYCLKENIKLVQSGILTEFILLNEKMYSPKEMNLSEHEFKMIRQVNIDKRLKYKMVMDFVDKERKSGKMNGYVVLSNSDIFLDKSLLKLQKSCLSLKPSWYCLLRFEYRGEKRLGKCRLFGPRQDSQDTWCFHTNFIDKYADINTTVQNQKLDLDFELGRPGCDNRLPFVLAYHSILLYNEPWKIKTYHYHKQPVSERDYKLPLVPQPYLFLMPIL